MTTMTLQQFRDSVVTYSDLRTCVGLGFENDDDVQSPGLVYANHQLYIEGPIAVDEWMIVLGNDCHYGTREELERELYEYGLSEGYFDSVSDDERSNGPTWKGDDL